MRKPDSIEHLYLDFDGFFASVEQLREPRLRGRPVGVVPYQGGGRTCIIACSREAKARGVKSVMMVDEARAVCRDLVLVPQKPDLYRRAHNALVSEIGTVIPVDQVKSIDELSCWLDRKHRAAPHELADRIKTVIRYNIGATLTCSIGMAANRHLAKIASDTRKPDGRGVDDARVMGRLLLTKAARRMRRANFYASALYLSLRGYERSWGDVEALGEVADDMAILAAFARLWEHVVTGIPPATKILRLSVTLGELTDAGARQTDMFANDDAERQRCEMLTQAMDSLNARYGQTVVSLGPWAPPAGGNVGSKISYTRIPEAEDNW